jgi:hypothetical protein
VQVDSQARQRGNHLKIGHKSQFDADTLEDDDYDASTAAARACFACYIRHNLLYYLTLTYLRLNAIVIHSSICVLWAFSRTFSESGVMDSDTTAHDGKHFWGNDIIY